MVRERIFQPSTDRRKILLIDRNIQTLGKNRSLRKAKDFGDTGTNAVFLLEQASAGLSWIDANG